jgi:hypothetical protein
MSKYFIIGEAGNDELWLVDVEKGTVAPLTDKALKTSGADAADLVKVIKSAKKQGLTTIKGVNAAIAVSSRSNVTTKSLSEDTDSN